MIPAPFSSMSLVQGTTVFSYDAGTGLLNVFLGVSKDVTVGDPFVDQPTGITILAPADGEGAPIEVPQWSDQEHSALTAAGYRTKVNRDRNYKNDFEFLSKPFDVICPPEHYAQLQKYYDDLTAEP